jgi:ribosomal-protein-alanine N-acetyltransferase
MPAPELATDRLRLRHWRDADLPLFAAMNADPDVMAHFAGTLSAAESDRLAERLRAELSSEAFGLWALEIPGTMGFAGFVGLTRPRFDAYFTPCIEIGWRLARPAWGHGYASEATALALRHGFATLGVADIFAITVPANLRSRAVMQRIGMTHVGEFEHPSVADGHALKRHLIFRKGKEDALP